MNNNKHYKIQTISNIEYRKIANQIEIFYAFFGSEFGKTLVAATKKGIIALYFLEDGEETQRLEELKSKWKLSKFTFSEEETKPYFQKIFFEKDMEIKIYLKGTDFQIKVWKALLELTSKELTTYSQIAQKINLPKAVRAVGSAVAKNEISFLIPCHKVLPKNGSIGNYRWGMDRKNRMLLFEGSMLK